MRRKHKNRKLNTKNQKIHRMIQKKTKLQKSSAKIPNDFAFPARLNYTRLVNIAFKATVKMCFNNDNK